MLLEYLFDARRVQNSRQGRRLLLLLLGGNTWPEGRFQSVSAGNLRGPDEAWRDFPAQVTIPGCGWAAPYIMIHITQRLIHGHLHKRPSLPPLNCPMFSAVLIQHQPVDADFTAAGACCCTIGSLAMPADSLCCAPLQYKSDIQTPQAGLHCGQRHHDAGSRRSRSPYFASS